MDTEDESIDISSIKRAILRAPSPFVLQPILTGNDQYPPSKNPFQHVPDTACREVQAADASPTSTQRPGQQVTQGFSHLASTVPDSQGLHQSNTTPNSFRVLAPHTHSRLVSECSLKKMATQSSPHDTQVLSPSHYVNLINVNKSKAALGFIEDGHSQDVADGVADGITQHTAHTGEPGYVDLGLSDGGDEPREQVDSDAELNSEPIAFSPTQATQHRLSQFPDSQRFRTPATNDRKRNCLGEVVESPALPRNPLALNGVVKTPIHALGLSQAFAATQAGSSPLVPRRVSEPVSDRPSPNIDMQIRPATASLSSPLRPRSELRNILTEPQSGYVSIKQSQAQRDRQATLRERSSDGFAADDQSDDDFDDEASIVEHVRRMRQRKECVRERFVSFSSLARPGSDVGRGKQSASAGGAETSSPIRSCKQEGSVRIEGDHPLVNQGQAVDDSEDETEVEEEHPVVVRRSSQLTHASVDEDKENMQAQALHVPETVQRLQRVLTGQEQGDTSPSNWKSSTQNPGEPLQTSQTPGEGIINAMRFSGSPTVAVANSQPDQPLPGKVVKSLVAPSNVFSGGSHVSSSASAATQVKSPPGHDVAEHHHVGRQPHVVGDNAAEEQRDHEVIGSSGDGLREKEASVAQPAHQTQAMPNMRIDDITRAGPPSTVLETVFKHGSSSNLAQSSSLTSTSTNDVHDRQQSSRYETARTHLSSGTSLSRPLNSLFASPTGNKRKRPGDNVAEPSPTKLRGEVDVAVVMAAMDDAEFYQAVEGGPESSSPTPPGRDVKRRRPGYKPASSSPVGDPAGSRLPSSPPPAGHLLAAGHILDPARSASRSDKQGEMRRQSTAIWDVQTSPPKSTPTRSKSNMVREHALKPCKRDESTVTGMLQDGPHQQVHPVAFSRESSETPSTDRVLHPISTEVIAPNQVLACFNGNRREYYPATCLSSTIVKSENKVQYQIEWDDGSRDEIDSGGICSLDFRVGDQVKVNLRNWPRVSHVVQGFKDRVDGSEGEMTDIRGFRTLLVKRKKRKSLPAGVSPENVKEVPMSAVYLDTSMWRQMKERTFTFHPAKGASHSNVKVLLPAPSRSSLSTPSERPSTPSTPSSRTRRRSDFTAQTAITALPCPGQAAASGIFFNMAFAISYDDEVRKTSLVKAISANGGTLVGEDFHQLFAPHASPSPPSRRGSQTNLLALNSRFSNTGFVALIADRHSRKLKYMQALALGIPTLSGKWIEACVAAKTILSWQAYLLAAGESMELEGAVRSRVLVYTDANTALLKDMISTRPKLLRGEAAIVVRGRGKAEEKRRPYIFLAEAAGAGRVETCINLKSVSTLLERDNGEGIKWVFVDDKELRKAEAAFLPQSKSRKSGELRVVGNEFLCQSLILGRLVGYA